MLTVSTLLPVTASLASMVLFAMSTLMSARHILVMVRFVALT